VTANSLVFPSSRHDDEPLAPRGLREAVVEGDDGKNIGPLVARDQRGGELEGVGRSQRMCGEEPASSPVRLDENAKRNAISGFVVRWYRDGLA